MPPRASSRFGAFVLSAVFAGALGCLGCFISARCQVVVAARAAAPARFVAVLQESPDEDGVEEVHAKKLAGSVHMALEKDTPLALVLVEECDPTFSNVLGSTHTDHYGNFELKPGRRGKIHYLRLSAQGFGTREYEVILAPDAPDLLKLEMQLAAKSQSRPARRLPGRVFDS